MHKINNRIDSVKLDYNLIKHIHWILLNKNITEYVL